MNFFDRPVESIDSIDIANFFVRSKIVEKVDCVESIDFIQKSSKSEPYSRFFGRWKIFATFDLIDSIFRSIRSISCPRAMVDLPAGDADEVYSAGKLNGC